MTPQEEYQRKRKTYKMMLWFGMVSIIMVFAGLTSAFVISKSRPDWLQNWVVPQTFIISTVVLLLSSVSFTLAHKAIKKDNRKQTTFMLFLTLGLAVVFAFLQFEGFNALFKAGLIPVGKSGSITISFLYAFVIMHLAHLVGGMISILVIIYNHFKQKYNSAQTLGIELGAMFWHFLDFLWVYLFLFFYFYK